MLVLILYCGLFRSIISSVVPPLPASDCALIHQRRKSSNQWRRGWAGFVFIHHLAACQWQESSRSYFQVLVWPLVTCLARRSLPGHQVGQPEPRWVQHLSKRIEKIKCSLFAKVHLLRPLTGSHCTPLWIRTCASRQGVHRLPWSGWWCWWCWWCW